MELPLGVAGVFAFCDETFACFLRSCQHQHAAGDRFREEDVCETIVPNLLCLSVSAVPIPIRIPTKARAAHLERVRRTILPPHISCMFSVFRRVEPASELCFHALVVL